MAIVVRFTPTEMTTEKYDQIIERLEKAGAGSPEGRLFHVCFGPESAMNVSDIWESREAFQRFGQTLTPILAELGIDPGEPAIYEVYNTIEGAKAGAAGI